MGRLKINSLSLLLCAVVIGNPGEWTEWGNWTDCSRSCDWGFRTRQRECVSDLEGVGEPVCADSSVMSQLCRLEPCPPSKQ